MNLSRAADALHIPPEFLQSLIYFHPRLRQWLVLGQSMQPTGLVHPWLSMCRVYSPFVLSS